MKRHNFKELQIWHLAMDIANDVYELTQGYPKEELFGLTLQKRKSSVSIASNIAEGCGRGTHAQLLHFLNISQGSAFELETQTYVAMRRKYASFEKLDALASKIKEEQKMIDGFYDFIIKNPTK